jgi:hypothetical protein
MTVARELEAHADMSRIQQLLVQCILEAEVEDGEVEDDPTHRLLATTAEVLRELLRAYRSHEAAS